MKPSHEPASASPASNRPKPCAPQKNAPEILTVRRSLLALVGKTGRCQKSAFPSETPRLAPLIIAIAIAHKSSLPWLVDDRAILRPRRTWCLLTQQYSTCSNTLARAAALYQVFRDSAPCLSRATTSQRAPNWSSEEPHLASTTLKPTKPLLCLN